MGNIKQTAVEWLFSQIPLEFSSSIAAFEAYNIAKEMEKEQILDAGQIGLCPEEWVLEYYEETYGTPQ